MNPWFPTVVRREHARMRLLCLSGAGVSATEFAAWPALLPSWVEVWPAQFPGRDRRIRERPAHRMEELADPLAEELYLRPGLPWMVFGHSFGALVGYEVTRRVPAVDGFVAASSVVPHRQRARLPDEESLLASVSGVPAELLADRHFADRLTADLRATLTLRRAYQPAPEIPLPCPLLAIAGTGDPDATAEDLARWRWYTKSSFEQQMLGRGHFFLRSHREPMLATLVERWQSWLS